MKAGDWVRQGDIGSGGFGAVVLWSNAISGEKIAIKSCRWGERGSGTENLMTPKVKERWQKEVEIMLKLDHRGIVTCSPLPAVFNKDALDLPRLCMEYCSGGDLRRVLLKADNCCGLRESSVRSFLSDVTEALGYLHGLRIIHRDLKPENIVLQQQHDQVVYKLIDLGYAKELDQSSVCTSFVGTLQYLAPELFLTNRYTSSVDYWSLGLVAHEVITGQRPFLPNMPPARWMSHIAHKRHEDIRAEVASDGAIVFSTEIASCHHISRPLGGLLEPWLRSLLEWDPKRRGRHGADTAVHVFSALRTVLHTDILTLLCVLPVCQLLHVPVKEVATVAQLQDWVARETGIPSKDQELILPSSERVEVLRDASVVDIFPAKGSSRFLYVFGNTDSSDEDSTSIDLPPLVLEMLKDTEQKPEYYHQRSIYAQSVFLVDQQCQLYTQVQQALRAYSGCLQRCESRLSGRLSQLRRSLAGLSASTALFLRSLECDIQLYTRQADAGGVTSERVFTTWRRAGELIVQRDETCRQRVAQVAASIERVIAGEDVTTSVSIEGQRMTAISPLLVHYGRACDLYEAHRGRPKEQRNQATSSCDMIRLVAKFLRNRDKPFQQLLLAIRERRGRMVELQLLNDHVTEVNDQVTKVNDLVTSYQRQRQTDIWTLMDLVLRSSVPAGGENCPSTEHQLNTVTAVLNRLRKDGADCDSAGSRCPSLSAILDAAVSESRSLLADNSDVTRRVEELLGREHGRISNATTHKTK